MIEIKDVEEKVTPAKTVINIKDVFVKDLKFVDESGDVTDKILEALDGIDTVSFKITI